MTTEVARGGSVVDLVCHDRQLVIMSSMQHSVAVVQLRQYQAPRQSSLQLSQFCLTLFFYTHSVSLLFTVWYLTCVFVLFCILLVWSCGLLAFY